MRDRTKQLQGLYRLTQLSNISSKIQTKREKSEWNGHENGQVEGGGGEWGPNSRVGGIFWKDEKTTFLTYPMDSESQRRNVPDELSDSESCYI